MFSVIFLLLGSGLAHGATNGARLQISMEQAVLAGLRNNPSLRVERLIPDIRQTREDRERARFDTGIRAEISRSRESTAGRLPDDREAVIERSEARLDISHQFPSGTRVGVDALIRQDDPDEAVSQHTVRAGVSVTQALLQGAGQRVNRIGIRQAALDTRASRHELRGYTEALVARIETAYWNLDLAARRLAIVRDSAQLAARQLDDVEQRIAAGVLAPTERAAARAEVALRNGALINAGGDYDQARLTLLHLIRPQGSSWQTTVDLTESLPETPSTIDPVDDHVALATLMRSDLNAARLAWERGELEVVRTRNGVLPRLDLFVRLGQTAYAGSFGDAVGEMDDDLDFSAGIQLAHDLGRRAARANQRESHLLRDQAEVALANLGQLAALDVHSAHIHVLRADEHVRAAAETHAAQTEKLRAEMEKFDVGRSTAILVAQAQRDVMNAQLAETEARIRALTTRIALSRADGSLLLRRGIEAAD